MERSGDVVPLTLRLHYAHPLGDLAPYFRGLESGKAVATRCPTCGRAWFPPQLICPNDGATGEWITLSGEGRIVSVSISEAALPFSGVRDRRAYALAAFDGAENLAFGRVAGAPELASPGQRVKLARAPGEWPHPAQAAWLVIQAP